MDAKVSPLAMLTQACNKIESSMLGSSLNKSPKRVRTESDEPLSSSHAKHPKLASSPDIADSSSLPKVCQPLASSEKRKTPDRRPSSSTSVSSNTSSPLTFTSTASLAAAVRPPLYPPPGIYPPPIFSPATAAALGGLRPPHPPTPCTNAYCADPSCPTGAAFSAFLMGVPPPASVFLPPTLTTPPPTSSPAAAAAGATPPAPVVCNWTSNGEVCGRRFSSSEDLHGHLKTHTSNSVAATPSRSPPTATTTTLAALQAAQTQALLSTGVTTSALAALQAQAAKMTTPTTTPTTVPASATDLSAAAAARYHAAMTAAVVRPPGFPMGMPPMAAHPPAIPPHLASFYGLAAPYNLPMLYLP